MKIPLIGSSSKSEKIQLNDLGFRLYAPNGASLWREAEIPEGWRADGDIIFDEKGAPQFKISEEDVPFMYKYEKKADRPKIRLPVIGTSTPGEKKILSQLGFELGEIIDDEPLWREATIPNGWSVKVIDKRTKLIKNEENETIFRILAPHQRFVYLVIG